METGAEFLKLVKAKLSQKYYEQVKNDVDNGIEVNDSVFSLADFNGDGEVNENDKNLFEEYIDSYNSVFGDSADGTMQSVDDILASLGNELGSGVNTENADADSIIEEIFDNLVSQTDGEQAQGEFDSAKFKELKEKCLAAQTALTDAQTKYEKALSSKKKAEKRRDSLNGKYESQKSKYENANSKYNELMRKKSSESSKSGKNKNSKSNSRLEQNISEAKRNRDKALRDMGLAQSEYSMAAANVTFYDSSSTMYKAEYDKLNETYTALATEFGSMYDLLSDDEKAKYGENPFLLESSNDEAQS